jgi:hypothetical protein
MKNNVALDFLLLAAGGLLVYYMWQSLSKAQGAVQNTLPQSSQADPGMSLSSAVFTLPVPSGGQPLRPSASQCAAMSGTYDSQTGNCMPAGFVL